MKPSVHGQFRMEGDPETAPVENADDFIAKPSNRLAAYSVLFESWCTNEDAGKTILHRRGSLRGHFERLMSEPVSWGGGGFPEFCGRCSKFNLDDRFKRIPLATPSVSGNTCIDVGFVIQPRCRKENGSRTRPKNRPLRVSVHPRKQSGKKRLVTAGYSHRGGLAARKNERIKCLVNVFRTPAFNDVNINIQFGSRASQGFRMFMTGALKHRQTHTEHATAFIPSPISPTLQKKNKRGL